jgi:choice-of-anchor B domain-containing protein
MIDLRDPLQPAEAGCYTDDGYVHDAQCLVYNGPDAAYKGHEICINASVDKITVVDVTTKTAPLRLSATRWQGIGYVHQGWLTPDQRYLLVDDEFDERLYRHNARTYLFDLLDLDQPRLLGAYESAVPSADHNLYISGTYAFEANYTAGLRVLDLQHVDQAVLREVAWFDTFPGADTVDFAHGAWSAYPYFASGVVIVNTIDRGLFIVKPHLSTEPFTVQQVHLPLIMTR